MKRLKSRRNIKFAFVYYIIGLLYLGLMRCRDITNHFQDRVIVTNKESETCKLMQLLTYCHSYMGLNDVHNESAMLASTARGKA